jgi:hypothetical protein
MKAILFIPLVALLALASCKKMYTCECTTTKRKSSFEHYQIIYDYSHPQVTVSSRIIKDKKDAAKSSCESGNSVSYEPGPEQQNGQGDTRISTTCVIK